MQKKYISTGSTENANSGTKNSIIKVPEMSPVFKSSNVISLETVNSTEMDSHLQQDISTDCGASEYSETCLEINSQINYKMSEEIREKSDNKPVFDIFSEYIKHENNTNSQQCSENKGNVKSLQLTNSQMYASGNKYFPDPKICNSSLIPHYSEISGMLHKKSNIIEKTTDRISISVSNKNDSNVLTSISKPEICSDSGLKFTKPSDCNLSVVEVLNSSISKEEIRSFSSFVQSNSIVVSKLMDMEKADYGKNSSTSFSCVNGEGKDITSSNCSLENSLDSDIVCQTSSKNRGSNFCPHCSKCFASRFTLERHFLRSHKIPNPYKESNPEAVSDQIDKANNEKGFKNSLACVNEDCKEKHSSEYLFKRKIPHSLSQSLKDVGCKYICPRCAKAFRYYLTLKRHMFSHYKTVNALQKSNSVVVSEIMVKRNLGSEENPKVFSPVTENMEVNSAKCLLEERALNPDKICKNSKENEKISKRKHACPDCLKLLILQEALKRHICFRKIPEKANKKRYSTVVSSTMGMEIHDWGENSNSSLPYVIDSKVTDSENSLLKEKGLDLDTGYSKLVEYGRKKHVVPRCLKCFKFLSALERHIHSHNICCNDALREGETNKSTGFVSVIKENVNSNLRMPDISKSKLRIRKEKYIPKCPYCSKIIDNSSKCKLPSYKCFLCHITLSEYYLYIAHTQIYHGTLPKVLCGLCKRTFENRFFYKRHIALHKRGKPFHCKECGHSYTSSNELMFHICSRQKSRQRCAVCGKSFQKKSSLIRHYFVHWKERPCQCTFCKYTAIKRCMLNIHIKNYH